MSTTYSERSEYQMPWRKHEKPKKQKTPKMKWNDQKEFLNYDPHRGKGLGNGRCPRKVNKR